MAKGNIANKIGPATRPNASSKRPVKLDIGDELKSLSPSRAADRSRLAYLARKASHQVHRSDALEKLRKRFDDVLLDALPAALKDPGNLVRVEALEIIAEHNLKHFEADAILALSDRDWLVQDRAIWALKTINSETAIKAVKKVFRKLSAKARVSADGFLYTIDGDESRVNRLIASLEDPNHHVRMASAHELAFTIQRRDMKRTVDAIEVAIGREEYRVPKLQFRRAIRDLRGRFAD
jgi:HEAT repeat protein